METEQRLAFSFLEAHPEDAAALLERARSSEVAELLRNIPLGAAEALVGRMSVHPAADALRLLPPERAASILSRLSVDAAAVRLRPLKSEEREHLLSHMTPKSAAAVGILLRYPESCAGAVMDPHVLSLPEEITASDARARVRRYARHVLYYVYVVNAEQKLVGVVNLRELMLAPSGRLLRDFMRTAVARIRASADRRAVLVHPAWRDIHALPVVDDQDTLIGAIHYRTLRSLEREMETPSPDTGLALAFTLGELYWFSMANLLRGILGNAGFAAVGREKRHGA